MKIINFLIQSQICYLRKEKNYIRHLYEIQLIFEKFDRDKNGLISSPEFQYILSRGTG